MLEKSHKVLGPISGLTDGPITIEHVHLRSTTYGRTGTVQYINIHMKSYETGGDVSIFQLLTKKKLKKKEDMLILKVSLLVRIKLSEIMARQEAKDAEQLKEIHSSCFDFNSHLD